MATAVKDPFVGSVVGGRYQVRSRIASGGMGTVYRALDARLEREVALKVMHAHLAADSTFVERFAREARAAARLSHPGVVPVFDQGSDEGAVYLAMEHVPGRTLRDVLRARGALRLREALDVAEEVLSALAAAHKIGLVHRDVKPENILIGEDGRLRLVDFGLARAASASGPATSTLIGTVGYLAPELLSAGVADARADVYAVGMVLVELLTGAPAFAGSVPAQVAFRHVHEDVPLPSTIRADLPPAVDDLVRWSTARDRERRPADAQEMLDAVHRVRAACSDADLDAPVSLAASSPGPVAGQTMVAEHDFGGTQPYLPEPELIAPPPAAPPTSRPRRRRAKTPWIAAAVVLALLLATCAWVFTAGPLGRTAVPVVVGKTTADAREVLAGQHLGTPRVVKANDDSYVAGRVTRVTPDAGAEVRKGARVVLTVSLGPHLHAVPQLTGLTRAKAEAAIRAADLSVGTVAPDYSATVASGSVISQQTAVGKQLVKDERVDFTVSQGPEPIPVPQVSGLSKDDANAKITAAGLALGTVDEQPSTDVQAGDVISQSPADGTLAAKGQVDLVISTGPALVDVPSVVGSPVDQAVATLQASGFQASVNNVYGAPLGIVRDQSPANGQAPQGSTVTLTVF